MTQHGMAPHSMGQHSRAGSGLKQTPSKKRLPKHFLLQGVLAVLLPLLGFHCRQVLAGVLLCCCASAVLRCDLC
jgi:hypothetical protein